MLAAEVGEQRVVGVQSTSSLAVALAQHLRPALGDRVELAVAVELVAEQVAEQDRARPQLRRRARRATARRPRTGRARRRSAPRGRAASSSVVAIPPAIFAPALVVHEGDPRAIEDACGHRRRSWSCRWWRRSARCRAAGARRASPIASGASRISSLPGALVPPPPRSREIAPTPRARARAWPRRCQPSASAASAAGRRGVLREGRVRTPVHAAGAPASYRAPQRAHAHRQLADRGRRRRTS